MKKLIAIISALTMAVTVMCVGASAASTPSIKVFGNENTPAGQGEETSFDVRLADFSGIKGMDVKITSDKNAKFTKITSKDIELKENDNYTLKDNEIHIVELNSQDKLLLKVTAVASAEAKITVSATLAESGAALAQSVTTLGGTVFVSDKNNGTTSAEATVLNPSDSTKYFIPYGYVKDSSGKYIEKEADGSFKNVPSGQNYAEFPIPTDVVTFGVSEKENTTNTPQFGSYGVKATGKTFGTLSVIGDWDGFSAYYVKNSGVTIYKLMEAVLKYYNANEQAMNAANATHVILKYDGGKTVKIFKTKQTKKMWDNDKYIQYSLRVEGLAKDEQVAAVGYSIIGNTTSLSSEIKTYTAAK